MLASPVVDGTLVLTLVETVLEDEVVECLMLFCKIEEEGFVDGVTSTTAAAVGSSCTSEMGGCRQLL